LNETDLRPFRRKERRAVWPLIGARGIPPARDLAKMIGGTTLRRIKTRGVTKIA
jgi:hypothetical protein